MQEPLLIYLGIGAIAGILAGLLGVGGGLVFVPALFYCFGLLGFEQGLVLHLALGTSLAAIIFISLSSIQAHHRRGAVLWPLVRRLAPGIMIGTLLGALAAEQLSTSWLQGFFGTFALTVGLQMLLATQADCPEPSRRACPEPSRRACPEPSRRACPEPSRRACPEPSRRAGRFDLPGRPGQTLAGALIGLVSALVGIGGGSLTVPFLTACRVSIREAVATSSACGLPIAVAGTAGYLWTGWGNPLLPPQSIGYIHWPALILLATAGVLFAPLGAHLAHSLPTGMLRRLFGFLLLVLGLRMIAFAH
ncbi:MAG: sulfite exporter TauE/SafE family protein [Gammaproteobacteria bacterium]|nr:sulfite exporter TauE/SafE family protein [Gammaproteobacteria bacterium]MBU1960091.1 sulfite exporter TauE/SafE family protein [Gammaproteobacteria bacterium]